MHRVTKIAAATILALLVLPTPALAEGALGGEMSALRIGVSLVGLLVAIVLLVQVLGVRRVSLGGAIADKISYVVLAVLCLAASALAKWVGNFAVGITLEQTQLASELLVVLAMALFAAYFFSVSTAMRRYLKAMTGQEQLSDEMASPDAEFVDPESSGEPGA